MKIAVGEAAYRQYQDILANDHALRRAAKKPTVRLFLVLVAACDGDVAGVRRLADAGIDINCSDNKGFTPLHLAVSDGLLYAAHFLIGAGADVNAVTRKNETPLLMAVRDENTDMVSLLIRSGADLNRVEKVHFVSPLMQASLAGQTEIVKLLVEAGAGMDETNPMRSPAVLAAVNGHTVVLEILLDAGAEPSLTLNCVGGVAEISILEFLLRRGADVNYLVEDYGTPLIQACLLGSHKNAKFLLDQGADPDLSPLRNTPPLAQCIGARQTHLVPLLLEYGAEVNFEVDGYTYLLAAIEREDIQCMRALLEAGADPDIPERGEAMLRAHRNPEMVDLLRSYGGTDLVAETQDRLDKTIEAVVNGERERVLELLDTEWPIPQSYSSMLDCALTVAASEGRLQIAQDMLGRGANPDCVVMNSGLTPLLEAIRRGHSDVVQTLLHAGADVNKTSDDGYSPLLAASCIGPVEIVKQLVSMGADIDGRGAGGETALMMAAHMGHYDVVEALTDLGADMCCKDHCGVTALMIAADEGHVDIGEELVLRNANLNTQDMFGQTALMHAAAKGHLGFVRLLLDFGALTDIRNSHKMTALDIARAAGHEGMVNLLSQAA